MITSDETRIKRKKTDGWLTSLDRSASSGIAKYAIDRFKLNESLEPTARELAILRVKNPPTTDAEQQRVDRFWAEQVLPNLPRIGKLGIDIAGVKNKTLFSVPGDLLWTSFPDHGRRFGINVGFEHVVDYGMYAISALSSPPVIMWKKNGQEDESCRCHASPLSPSYAARRPPPPRATGKEMATTKKPTGSAAVSSPSTHRVTMVDYKNFFSNDSAAVDCGVIRLNEQDAGRVVEMALASVGIVSTYLGCCCSTVAFPVYLVTGLWSVEKNYQMVRACPILEIEGSVTTTNATGSKTLSISDEYRMAISKNDNGCLVKFTQMGCGLTKLTFNAVYLAKELSRQKHMGQPYHVPGLSHSNVVALLKESDVVAVYATTNLDDEDI